LAVRETTISLRMGVPLLELYVWPSVFPFLGLQSRFVPEHWMTFKNKIIAGFGTALIILIFVGILSSRSMIADEEDRAWVAHTHIVLEKLDGVLANLLEAETSQRGYLISGEEPYLETFNEARTHVNQRVLELRELTADNPVQHRALDHLEPLLAAMLSTLQYRIVVRDQEGLTAAAKEVSGGSAMLHMTEIRATIADMAQEENTLLKRRTEEVEASLRKTRIMIVTGEVLAVVFLCLAGATVGQGITQRKRAEIVRRLNTDLERRVKERTAELDERARELARSNAELEQFAYVASHDLQEPLRMVASFTQLLAKRYEDKLDDDAREFINYAVDGATRMQSLISDLLNYSRVGTQGKPLAPTDGEALFNRVLKSLKFVIEESGAVISRDPLPVVMADPQQLGQLFQNLLTNAIKFRGEEPPCVKISVERNGSDWKISVRDNGIGISQEHADRIFIIFQRLHTKTDYPGTGIGLAICKKIVERHGGRIWVEPGTQGGSEFCFTIPAAPIQNVEEREQNELRIRVAIR
jgi:signal transduction histidine kinase